MLRKVLVAICLLFWCNIGFSQQVSSIEDRVDSLFATLTTDQKLGQLFLTPVNAAAGNQHISVIEKLVEGHKIGGLYFTQGSADRIVALRNKFKQQFPLLTAIRLDDNLKQALTNNMELPSHLTMHAIQNDSLVRQLGWHLGRQIERLGIDLLFLDGFEENGNLENQLSTNNTNLLIEGLHQSTLLLGVADYPGWIEPKSSRSDVLKSSIIPYGDAIEAQIDAVSFAAYGIPFEKNVAASQSATLHKKLRNDFAFGGLAVAENLASNDNYRPGRSEAQAILAGSDLVISNNIPQSIKRLRKLMRKKKVNYSDLVTRVKKVLTYKLTLNNNEISTQNLKLQLNAPCTANAFLEAQRSALTVLPGSTALPLVDVAQPTFASLTTNQPQAFIEALDSYARFTHYTNLEDNGLSKKLSLYDYVVVGHFEETLNESLTELINSLNTKVILCTTGHPARLAAIREDFTKIITYQNEAINQQLLAEALFGATSAQGKLPVAINNQLTPGSGIATKPISRLGVGLPEEVRINSSTLRKIDGIAHEAIASQATPGCQVLVARKGKIIYNKSFGYYTYDSLSPVDGRTIYDIASITKVAATTQILMFLEERNLIHLDKKISKYLPELSLTNKANMTIRDILTHQAGLWPYLPFWKNTLDNDHQVPYYSSTYNVEYPYQISDGIYASQLTRDSLWQWVKASKLRKKTYRKPYDYRYSDMGYYILQRLIEQVTNQPMEDFLKQNFYDPLGLTTLSYLPLCEFSVDEVAPTECDDYFRNTLVNGLVHDQGAAMMGGVAGHAGLFSNAMDLAKLMQMNLQDGFYGGHRYFKSGTIERFTTIQYANNRRGLGWDKPVVGEWNSPTSVYASKRSFGHTGFTGTAVWVDPEFDLIYVFLSNRIYPDAENRKLIKNNIRSRIQDVIYQSIFDFEKQFGDTCKAY